MWAGPPDPETDRAHPGNRCRLRPLAWQCNPARPCSTRHQISTTSTDQLNQNGQHAPARAPDKQHQLKPVLDLTHHASSQLNRRSTNSTRRCKPVRFAHIRGTSPNSGLDCLASLRVMRWANRADRGVWGSSQVVRMMVNSEAVARQRLVDQDRLVHDDLAAQGLDVNKLPPPTATSARAGEGDDGVRSRLEQMGYSAGWTLAERSAQLHTADSYRTVTSC